MDSKAVCAFLLALLGVALALAGWSVEFGLASKAGPHAARQMMAPVTTATATSTMGLVVHRRILGSINPSSLNPDKPACIGKCPAPGGAYTRGCSKAYQCAG